MWTLLHWDSAAGMWILLPACGFCCCIGTLLPACGFCCRHVDSAAGLRSLFCCALRELCSLPPCLPSHRPKAFFLAAIDVPGFGQTEGVPSNDFFGAKLLLEVIQSLGKAHAFAMIVYGQGAPVLLTALLRTPKLTSFVVLREADVSTIDIESLHGILHPCFAPFDPDGLTSQVRSARNLNAVLSQITAPKFSLTKVPKYFQKEFATELIKFFRFHGWTGAQSSDGNSQKLPLLTRLAGGMNCWKGTGLEATSKAAKIADAKAQVKAGAASPKTAGAAMSERSSERNSERQSPSERLSEGPPLSPTKDSSLKEASDGKTEGKAKPEKEVEEAAVTVASLAEAVEVVEVEKAQLMGEEAAAAAEGEAAAA